MPLYIYECDNDHRTERFYKIAEKPDVILCECGKQATQLLAIGGIQTESPTWINDHVRGCLQDDDMLRQGRIKPIETRSELERFTRERGLVCVG